MAGAISTSFLRGLGRTGLALLVMLLASPAAQAAKGRSAAVLARVLSFELSLDERVGPSIGVAVVYRRGDPVSESNADDWIQAFAQLSSVRIKDRPLFAVKIAFAPTELVAQIDRQGIDVLLVADGLAAETEAIARVARAKHVLTAGNPPSYVERDLTLCVTEQNGTTEIIVNLKAARLEGVQFSSNLLKLARIIR